VTPPERTPPVDVAAWAAPPPAGVHKYVPITRWLPGYRRSWLARDVPAGLTVWGLVVPAGMGYAGIAGMPLQAALYTLLVTLPLYAVFGGVRQLVVASTAASASITGATVAELGPPDGATYAAMVAVLVIATGVAFLVAGLLRLGFVAVFVPRPVMVGLVFGLGLFIMTKQLYKLFGIPEAEGTTVEVLVADLRHLGQLSVTTTAVGLGSIAVLLLFERYLGALPGALVVLLGGIALSAVANLDEHGVSTVGEVPAGLPSVVVPDLPIADVLALVATAVGLMLVITSESLAGADTLGRKHGHAVDTDQELRAYGLANVASGLLGGLASGGSMSASSVGDRAGARTPVTLLAAWVMVVLTLLFLTPVFTPLPEAVLAAIIIVAVKGLLDVPAMRRVARTSRVEYVLGLVTLLTVILWDVLPAMILGMAFAVLVMTYRASRTSVTVLAHRPGAPGVWRSHERHPGWETVPGVLVVRGDAQLFYANAATHADAIRRAVGSADPTPHTVVLDLEATRLLDVTGTEILAGLVGDLRAAGIRLLVAGVGPAVLETAGRSELRELIGPDAVRATIEEAVQAATGTMER
jgi:high affinity sulfate transporter 1